MSYFKPSAAQKELLARVNELGNKWLPNVNRWDKEDHAPLLELLAEAREYGLTGITVPKQYGGLDLTMMDYTICVEELCRVTKSWLPAEAFFRTSGPCPALIMAADNEAVKEKFLPEIVAGTKAGTIGLTEPLHGSGLTDLESVCVEDDGDGWILNGSKRFITGAVEDDLYATFVRFGDIPGPRGIGAVVTEKSMPGLTMERGPEVIGARSVPHGNMYFENVRIPKENLILPKGNFARLMRAFNVERMHNSALSVGLAQGAFDEAEKYVRERKQFGRPVIEFQAVYHKLAEMHIDVEAARALTYKAALTADQGKFPLGLEVSSAKILANKVGRDVCWKSMQLHGGDGVTRDYPVQQAYRDVCVASYGGGTADVGKNVVASMLLGEKFDQHKN